MIQRSKHLCFTLESRKSVSILGKVVREELQGDVTLKFIASSEAMPFSGAIRIAATEDESGIEHSAVVNLTSSTENNGVPGGFTKLVVESTPQIWLTVPPKPEPKVEKPK